jgi:acetate---CoA ligase (ADP-forming)
LPETMPEAIAQRLVAAGVVPFNGMSEGLTAMRLAAEVGEAWAKPASARLQPVIRTPTARQVRMLDEAAAKAALARFGLAVPVFRVVPIAEAARAAEDLGFPVVVKALSAALAHKTDAGGVRLGLGDAAAVKQAAAGMAHLSERVLIEPMKEGALAELIVGVTRDALFGLGLTVGAGGVLADLIDDHATLLLPASRAEIEAALRSLKIARLLDGYRGAARGDWPSLDSSVESVAHYAEAHRDTLIELDVNPLLVFAAGSGAVAVDALIRLNEEVSE